MLEVPHFINVDLDLDSPVSLKPLIAAFTAADVFMVNRFRKGKRFRAGFEIFRPNAEAGVLIRAFVRVIERLPADAKRVWAGAERTFTLGVEAPARPAHLDVTVDARAVRAAASVGAQIGVVIYLRAPERSSTKRQRKA